MTRLGLLAKLAVRNLVRRRAQTAIVLAGLLVGTAVVTASLTVADSLRYGIRRATYDGLGPADEFVELAGQRYFPQSAYDALANDTALRDTSHALSPVVIDSGSVRDTRTRETEPSVGLAGFVPATDAAFGRFHLTDGRIVDGSALGPNEAYLREDVAARLDAKPGDTLVVGVQQATLPLTDVTYPLQGTITGAGAGCPAAPAPLPTLPIQTPCAYTPDPADNVTYTIPVSRGAAQITVLLEPIGPEDSPTRADLDIIATSPSGNRTAATGGEPGSPSDPAVLRVDGHRYLERGNWIIQVTTKAGAAAKFTGAIFVSYAQYDATGGSAAEGSTIVGDADASAYLAVGTSNAAHQNMTVAGIVTREGKGAFLGTTGLFVNLATAQSLVGQPAYVNAVKISNDGSTEGGLAHAAAPTRAATRVLDNLRANNPDDPVYDHLAVSPVKAQGLAGADQESKFYRDFLAAVSSLTLIAGALLVVHVFILLAAERKRELASARAIGLSRGAVVGSFAMEGFVLAVLAAVGGVVVGVLGAGGVLLGFDYILSAVGTNLGTFVLHPEVQSLAIAAGLGFSLTLLAAVGASWRVGGLNLVRAMRGAEEDDASRRGSPLAWLVLAALALLSAAASGLGDAGTFTAWAFAPAFALGALALALRRRWALALGGALLMVEGALAIFLLTPPADALGRVLGVLRGVPLALGIALLALNTDALARGAEALLWRIRVLRPTAALTVRYPFRRPSQTGLTVTMFAFVTLVLVFFSIFGTTFALNIAGETGGYDVYATTDAPYSDLRYSYDLLPAGARDPYALANISYQDPLLVATVPGGNLLTLDHARPHYKGAPVDRAFASLPDFPRREQFAFAELDPHYANGSAAFEALLKDPTLAIVSVAYTLDETGNPGAHHVGADLAMNLSSGEKHLRVIGVLKELYLGGVWVNPLVLRTGFQSIQGGYLIRVAPGHDPVEVAQQLERSFDGTGLHAVDLRTEAGTVLEENEQFLRMFQMFLGFGLVVGIASLTVVAARSVLERRPHIGVLRALGHSRVSILTWLMGESLLVTIIGTLVGVVAGSLLAFGVWYTTVRPVMDVPFSYSYIVIPVILLITWGCAIVAVFLPGFLATRESPAGMVRRVD